MVGLSDEETSANPGEKLDIRQGKRNPGEPFTRFAIGDLRTLDELLEPGARRLARPVLRERGGGDITSLPDQIPIQHMTCAMTTEQHHMPLAHALLKQGSQRSPP